MGRRADEAYVIVADTHTHAPTGKVVTALSFQYRGHQITKKYTRTRVYSDRRFTDFAGRPNDEREFPISRTPPSLAEIVATLETGVEN